MSSDARAVPVRKQRDAKSKGRTKALIIWSSVGLVFLLMMVLLVLWVLGTTYGREFDAGAWTFRKYSFLRNPITGRQLTGIEHTSDFTVPTNIKGLVAGGPLAPGTRWDLVEISATAGTARGQAHVLLDYLSAFDRQNNFYWETWTTQHGTAAAILWPAVRDCVHLPRYDRLPELFDAARTTVDPMQLKAKLDQLMLDIAEDEIKFQTAAGNSEAVKRATILKNAYSKN